MAALSGDYVQVLVGGYDLTGDTNRVAIVDALDTYDATTFGDQVHKGILGLRRCVIGHGGFLNPVAGKEHPLLKQLSVTGAISIYMGQNATPRESDPVYSIEAIEGQYTVSPEYNDSIPFTGLFAQHSGKGGWGTALVAQTIFTNTFSGITVDNGNPSSAGGNAFLHVLQASSGDTYTFTIEGATDSLFTLGVVTVATFTLNGASLGSEAVSVVGAIPRYTRFKAVRAGSNGNSVKVSASLTRF